MREEQVGRRHHSSVDSVKCVYVAVDKTEKKPVQIHLYNNIGTMWFFFSAGLGLFVL